MSKEGSTRAAAAHTVNPSALCQVEFPVSNAPRALAFYRDVLGWHPSPAEIHNYIVMETPEASPIGISLVINDLSESNLVSETTPQTVVYFKVTNAESICDTAIRHGGSKRFGPRLLPAYGKIWQIADPDGNRIGLFENLPSVNIDKK